MSTSSALWMETPWIQPLLVVSKGILDHLITFWRSSGGVLVVSATAAALWTTFYFFSLYLWTVNRQTHLKKTKGSSITHKRKRLDEYEQNYANDEDDEDDEDDDSDDSDDSGDDNKSCCSDSELYKGYLTGKRSVMMSTATAATTATSSETIKQLNTAITAAASSSIVAVDHHKPQPSSMLSSVVSSRSTSGLPVGADAPAVCRITSKRSPSKSSTKLKKSKTKSSVRADPLVIRKRRKWQNMMKVQVDSDEEEDDDDNIKSARNFDKDKPYNNITDMDAAYATDATITDDENEAASLSSPTSKTAKRAAAAAFLSDPSSPSSSVLPSMDELFWRSMLAQIKVFSYLSEEALQTCLEYVENMHLSQGQVLFDQNQYDGSLYAVVSGEISCQFHDYTLEPEDYEFYGNAENDIDDVDGSDDDEDDEDGNGVRYSLQQQQKAQNSGTLDFGDDNNNQNNDNERGIDSDEGDSKKSKRVLTFTSGPGDTVTPLLATLAALVVEYQNDRQKEEQEKQRGGVDKNDSNDKNVPSSSPSYSHHSPSSSSSSSSSSTQSPLHAFGRGVSAIATKPNTRLVRVPPKCFVAVMRKYPADVHRIAQTILCRLQRVTVITLVKTLGLRSELLEWRDLDNSEGHQQQQQLVSSVAKQEMLSTALDAGDEQAKRVGSKIACQHLGISHEHEAEATELIYTQSSIISLPPGKTLIETGVPHHAAYLLLQGTMEIGMMIPRGAGGRRQASPSSFQRYRKMHPGSLLGRLVCFTGDVSIFAVRCYSSSSAATSEKNDNGATLLQIPKRLFNSLIVAYPEAMAKSLGACLSVMSPITHLLNWNSDWMHVQAAEVVANRGDPCDSLFVVLNGRLRASYRVSDRDSENNPSLSSYPSSASRVSTAAAALEERTFEDYGGGKCVGEVGGLTGSCWPCDVFAIRNSELARIPLLTIIAIVRAHPRAGLHFARRMASQVQAKYGVYSNGIGNRRRIAPHSTLSERPIVKTKSGFGSTSSSSVATAAARSVLPSYGLTLATIAVVPLSSEVDLPGFCQTLESVLGEIAPSTLMTKAKARRHLGDKLCRHPKNAMFELKLNRLLGDTEESHRLVVYQADLSYTWWTRLCVQQADCILLVVDANKAPDKKRVEQCLEWAYESMQVRIELVVVGHSISSNGPKHGEDQVEVEEEEEEEEEMNVSDQLNNWSEGRAWVAGHHLVRVPFDRHTMDIRRMCRRITGLSVGLVLGGGGARGLAHLGVIRALVEAGVTIDMVGGTSQGALVGALYARNPDHLEAIMEHARKFAESMSSMKEKLWDLTLPMTSIFTGRRFNYGIRRVLGRARIQDLVLNFFCVTTDIQKRQLVVHTKGSLWKYVRASMSLTGYLPPLAEDGSLLVDGGYLNVVPADVMRQEMGARTVIAVDVSPESERDYFNYGTHLSGWWLLWNSWNPFCRTVKVPSMGDISDTLRWVSSDQHRKNVVHATDLHLTPPISEYGTLEFDKFDEIVEIGYLYAKPLVDEWVRQRNAEGFRLGSPRIPVSRKKKRSRSTQ